jgi:uncharacterized protein (TIGR02594 family)
MIEPKWLTIARGDIGTAEIPGPETDVKIRGWLRSLRAWWDDDATPWCGVAMAAWMQQAGFPLPKYWMRARDWATWGQPLPGPRLGCIVVFSREGGGHVGLVVGRTSKFDLMVLGGNQGDAVNIKPFSLGRVLAYCWPPGAILPPARDLPVMESVGPLSRNEA